MSRRHAGLATLFAVLTLLAIASLVLLAASRQLVLIHANAQNQHRYHQALDNAEEGLRQGSQALANGQPLPADNDRFSLTQQAIPRTGCGCAAPATTTAIASPCSGTSSRAATRADRAAR
ncbi:hypothetical protein [Chromobacterium vaccinii]|uniref:hypothetical protein n=1 Tax=Chromobacterium vaccinii TaxID=1108595 RepID=UPI00164269A5|nr:hypothetical protein [Chromobacterium vaccinii]